MTSERHPLLEQAEIDDGALDREFAEMGMVEAPGLTFQYDPQGGLIKPDHSPRTPLREDAPAIYRERFIRRWSEAGRDGTACWERLRGLVEARRRLRPNSEAVAEWAWLVGLIAEMPAGLRDRLRRLAARIEACRTGRDAERVAAGEIVRRARERGEPQVLRTWLTDRCHNASLECDFDAATEFVLPDGSHRTEYRCCY